jgi:hypothetical protein
MEVEKSKGTFGRVYLSNIGRFIPAPERKKGMPGPRFPDIAAGAAREGYNKKIVFRS